MVRDAFDVPKLVSELSSRMNGYGLRLSAAGDTMYLNYATVAGGNADLWVATRSCH